MKHSPKHLATTPVSRTARTGITACLAVALGASLFVAPAATAAEYHGEDITVTVPDSAFGALEAAGISVDGVDAGTGIDFDVSEVDAGAVAEAHGLEAADSRVELRVIGGDFTYDKGVITSKYAKGDATTLADLEATTSPLGTYVTAHSSFHKGGIEEGTLRTWVTDDERNALPSEPFVEAGLRGHNPATFSDATDGTTGFYVQAFVFGSTAFDGPFDGVDDYIAVATTNPIWIDVDTSNYDFPAEATADGATWTVKDGKPVSTQKHFDDDFKDPIVTTFTYDGDLKSTGDAWHDADPDLRVNESLFVAFGYDSTTGSYTTGASGLAGITGLSVTNTGPGEAVLHVETQTDNATVYVDGGVVASAGARFTTPTNEVVTIQDVVRVDANRIDLVVSNADGAEFVEGGAWVLGTETSAITFPQEQTSYTFQVDVTGDDQITEENVTPEKPKPDTDKEKPSKPKPPTGPPIVIGDPEPPLPPIVITSGETWDVTTEGGAE